MDKFKKNQIVVYSIVLMLVVAGYLNYIENDNAIEISANTQNTTNIGDATLVSNNETIETGDTEAKLEDENGVADEIDEDEEEDEEDNIEKASSENMLENKETTTNVSSNANARFDEDDEYFANSRLEREKMYSQMLETYQKILENATISEEQKSIASTEITKINNTRNAIMICENLIAIKGFEEAVILANGESVNVVVKAKDLTSEEIAQIQNIVTREMETSIENIHIMKK